MSSGTNMSPGRSTGNDIVALNGIDKARTIQPRFYSKILSAGEHALYDAPELAGMRFENFVWLLWSVKESVYKYLGRSTPGLVFSPTRIIVQRIDPPAGLSADPAEFRTHSTPGKSEGGLWESTGDGHAPAEEFYFGRVVSGSHTLYFRSTMHEAFISTVVHDQESFENNWWGVQQIDHPGHADQSAAVRGFVLNKLNSLFPGEHLQIAKDPVGCPIVLRDGAERNIPVSLAHHDRYIAYSFRL